MSFDIVVATDSKGGIGKDGKLPWPMLKGDMRFFRELTTTSDRKGIENAVIMGRKTWDSLPKAYRPLPGRINMFLSRDENMRCLMRAPSLEWALRIRDCANRCFVIGGASVYAEALKHPDLNRIYRTEVQGEFDCDTFFPEIPARFNYEQIGDWVTENGTTYRFTTLA